MLLIASTFCGSGMRPFELMMWPKNGISVHLTCILHLSALKQRLVSQAHSITAFRFVSWSDVNGQCHGQCHQRCWLHQADLPKFHRLSSERCPGHRSD